MKFRAIFCLKSRPNMDERIAYVDAPQATAAREAIVAGVAKHYGVDPSDVEFWNFTSEFEDPAAVLRRETGWRGDTPIAWDTDPLEL